MWNEKAKKRIDYLLENYENKNEYAVFDCDNTILMNDIQFAMVYYILKFKKFKITKEQYFNSLLELFPNEKEIIENFFSIYDEMEKAEKDSDEYLKFLANYEDIVEYIYLKYHYDITSFLISGLTEIEVENLILDAIKYHENVEFGVENFIFEDSISSYKTGLKITEEMENLIKELNNKNIFVYIISGSPTIFVKIALKSLNSKISNIWGRELEIVNGIYTGYMKKDEIFPMGDGKTKIIDEFLVSKYNKGPLIVAGDSMGDYPMLTKYEDTKLSLLIDRNRKDKFKELILKNDDRYIAQRVDERIGIFIPGNESITF